MVVSGSETTESSSSVQLPQKEEHKRDLSTRIFSLVAIFLILLGTPLIITLGFLFHNNLLNVFGYWGLFSVVTLVILAVFSIYEMLKEEGEKSKEKDLTQLKRDLSFLFRYKHIVIPLLVLLILSGLGSISHFFTSLFSLQLVYTAVIILVLEVVFHSLHRFWPRVLKERSSVRNIFLTLLVFLGIFLSLLVVGTDAVFIISIIFAALVLISGIGLAFTVEIAATELSKFRIPDRSISYVTVIAFFTFLAFWIYTSFGFTRYFVPVGFGAVTPPILKLLEADYGAIETGLNIALITAIISAVAGTAYFVYSLLKKDRGRKINRFIFIVSSIPIAGFIFVYLAILADSDWSVTFASSHNLFSYFLQLLPSILLFIVGYSQLMIEIPRKTSRTLMLEENKLVVSLTWLIVLSAIAEFLSWTLYGQPGVFLFEVDIVQWFGVPIGIGLIAYKYVKKK